TAGRVFAAGRRRGVPFVRGRRCAGADGGGNQGDGGAAPPTAGGGRRPWPVRPGGARLSCGDLVVVRVPRRLPAANARGGLIATATHALPHPGWGSRPASL